MMNSVSPECQELKSTYDECFNKWFKEKYLKGSTRDPCTSIFKSYQECVKKAIKERGIELWDVEKDVLGTEREKQPPPKTGNTDSDKQSQKTKDSKKQ